MLVRQIQILIAILVEYKQEEWERETYILNVHETVHSGGRKYDLMVKDSWINNSLCLNNHDAYIILLTMFGSSARNNA